MTGIDPTPDEGRGSVIPGVRLGRVTRHADDRGSFREIWRASWYAAGDETAGLAPFSQANVSESAPGVLRGLHAHRRQLDHWVILEGSGTAALVDLRPLLAGAARPTVEVFDVTADDRLSIPSGVAHGFLATTRLVLAYVVTQEYDGSDELGFAWDDPLAAVPWPPAPTPDGRPILSDRDRTNPPLLELLERFR